MNAPAGTSVYAVKRDMARELADCHGIIGAGAVGVCR
jgi:hypothetical protein